MGFFHGKINGFFLNTLEKPFKHSLVSTSTISVMKGMNPVKRSLVSTSTISVMKGMNPVKRSLVSTSIVSAMLKMNPENSQSAEQFNQFPQWKTQSRVNLLLGILFGALIFISCESQPTIPQQKMIPLMADVIRLEASQQVEYNYQTLSDSLWTLNYSFVLKKHQTDSNEFKQTLEFYKRNPSDFSNLMGKVIDELQEEEIKRFRR